MEKQSKTKMSSVQDNLKAEQKNLFDQFENLKSRDSLQNRSQQQIEFYKNSIEGIASNVSMELQNYIDKLSQIDIEFREQIFGFVKDKLGNSVNKVNQLSDSISRRVELTEIVSNNMLLIKQLHACLKQNKNIWKN